MSIFSFFKNLVSKKVNIPQEINLGFWHNITKPAIVMAPMADVTDSAFRQMFVHFGKPDVIWTEFVSADGLLSNGFERLKNDLIFGQDEHPIVAQVFTSKPEKMYAVAQLIASLGFDGMDINMGCPDRSIEKQKCGAAMVKDMDNAVAVLSAALKGAGSMPVSVKIRLGYNSDVLETWLPKLLSAGPAVVTLHARTRKEMSKVPARWERIKRAVEIRNELGSKTLIFGNGDVSSVEDAVSKAAETGADGVMVGRGIFGTPWFFEHLAERKAGKAVGFRPRSPEEKVEALIEHIQLFEKQLLGHKSYAVMKKHFKAYINDFEGSKELRAVLMETTSPQETISILRDYLK